MPRKKQPAQGLPGVTLPLSEKTYPHTRFSFKIDYFESIEEPGEGPGEVIRKRGGRRFVMCSYRNQGSLLDFLSYFAVNYPDCKIAALSLVKVIFVDDTRYGPQIEVGKIPFPKD